MSEFDRIVDECLADIAAGRETPDSCLQRYPAYAARLAPVLKTAERLRQMPPSPAMSPVRRRALESRYLQRAVELQSTTTRPKFLSPRQIWQRRFLMAVVATAIMCAILATTVTAASASVPGDTLYPVKRAAEEIRLVLTFGPRQMELRLALVQERLAEFRILTGRHEVSSDLMADISTETETLLEQIPSLPDEQQAEFLDRITVLADQNSQELQLAAAYARGSARDRVQAALADSQLRQNQVKEMLADLKATPDSSTEKDTIPPGLENRPVDAGKPPTTGPAAQPTAADESTKTHPTPAAQGNPPSHPDKPDPNRDHPTPGPKKQ